MMTEAEPPDNEWPVERWTALPLSPAPFPEPNPQRRSRQQPTESAGASDFPFKLSNASTTAGEVTTLKVKALAGQINAHSIDETLATVTVSGFFYAHVHDDTNYLENTWEVLNGTSVPDNTEHDGYKKIGSYTVASGVLTVSNLDGTTSNIGHLNAADLEHEWWQDA